MYLWISRHQLKVQGACMHQLKVQGACMHQLKVQGACMHQLKVQGACMHQLKVQGACIHHWGAICIVHCSKSGSDALSVSRVVCVILFGSKLLYLG